MTRTHNKFRAVLLAAIMVLSVFAGSLVFAGAVGATGAPAQGSATAITEGDDQSTTITFNNTTAALGANGVNVSIYLPSELGGSPEITSLTISNETDDVVTSIDTKGTDGDVIFANTSKTEDLSGIAGDGNVQFTVEVSGISVEVLDDNPSTSVLEASLTDATAAAPGTAEETDVANGGITVNDEIRNIIDEEGTPTTTFQGRTDLTFD